MRKWRIEDSEELYNIKGWGVNYFGINEKGHAFVRPRKDNVEIDLCDIVNDLTERDITAPVLLRFPDTWTIASRRPPLVLNKLKRNMTTKGEHFIVLSHQGEPDASRGRGNYLPR